jgi:hypothetical protein
MPIPVLAAQPCRREVVPWSPVLTWSEPVLQSFVLTRFLHANRFPLRSKTRRPAYQLTVTRDGKSPARDRSPDEWETGNPGFNGQKRQQK